MKKKFLSTMAAVVLSFTVLSGCQNAASDQTEAPASNEATTQEQVAASDESGANASAKDSATASDEDASQEETAADSALPTKDLAGNDITVPAEISSIISMSPSSTRLLVDLGLADDITACDTYSAEYYGDSLAADIPQFDMMTPDNEALISLNPDIIFTTGMSYAGGTDVYAAVREAGICIADIPSASSLAEIADSIDFIGACTGRSDEAADIVKWMNEAIDAFKAISDQIPEDEKLKVLYMSSTPTPDYPTIYSAGKGTYIDEMITVLGGINVAGDQEGWATLTEEAAIAADPDIIFTTDMYTPDVVTTLSDLEGWENVSAVVNDKVFLLEKSNEINQPNQHVVDALVEMGIDMGLDKYTDLYEEVEKLIEVVQ